MEPRRRSVLTDLLTQPITRREALRRGVAIGLAGPALAGILAACGGGSSSTPAANNAAAASSPTAAGAGGATSPVPTTKAGGGASTGASNTIIAATTISDAVTLDPNVAFEFSSTAAVRLMYDTMVRFPYGDLTQVQPSLATKWSRSDDGKTWTFNLKDGVKFSSGNPVTAQDVVYSFQRVVSLPKDPASWLITQMGIDDKNFSTAITAPDASTVVITLPQDFSPGAFLAVMANQVSSVVDTKVVKSHEANGDMGTTWLANNSAGSGPYTLSNWTRDVKIEMVANPNYNLGNAPSIKRVVWQGIATNTTQLDMLKRGQADIATDLSGDQLASLKGNDKVTVYKTPQEAMIYLGMDVKNVPAFAKAEARNAVKYAIDYDGIVNHLLLGNAATLQGVIPKGIFGYTDSTPFTHDPAKAKQLLADAGFAQGFTVTMLIPDGTMAGGVSASSLGDALRANLADIGITANIRQLAASELYTQYRNHQAQLVLGEWAMDYPDPGDFAAPFGDYSQQSLIWRLQDDDTQLQDLVQKAGTMENTPDRAKIYAQINDLEAKQGPFALLYQPDVTLAYNTTLHGLKYDDANSVNYPEITKS